MKRRLRSTLAILLLCAGGALCEDGAASSPVAGGVTFRTDDNGTAEYWRRRAEVFDRHGLTFGAALNLLAAEGIPGLIDVIKHMQATGHDIMDHTPPHSNIIIAFTREDDLTWCRSHPGVDHY